MKLIKKLDSPLIKGSIILVISFGLFNFINFLFQFFMARMLSIEEYGILASIFSIIYIFSVFTDSIQNVMVKYSAIEETDGRLKNIFKRFVRRLRPISLVIFIGYLIVALFLSPILKIDYSLLALTGIMFLLAFFTPLTRGILQGRKRFNSLSINMAVESALRLIMGLLLVFLGIGVLGAVLGTIIGGGLAFGLSLFQTRGVLKAKEEETKPIGVYNYAKPSLVITAVVIIFCSLDVILARIFFSAEIAGSYAIASVLGKIIFWGTSPVSKAMLPFSSIKEAENGRKKPIFFTALILILLGIGFILAIFSIFPGQIISIFSEEAVPIAINILFYNGISFGLISIANLILLYRLSTGAIYRYSLLPVFLIIEVVLLSVFSNSLMQFTQAFIVSSLIFSLGSLLLLKKKNPMAR